MAMTLLGPDAWLSQNMKKNVLETPLRGQTRGSVCGGSDLSDQNIYIYQVYRMKFGIGFM